MQWIRLILAFQQKLFLPTFSLALGIGVAGYFMIWSTPVVEGIGFGYLLAGPATHYFVYEITHKHEYYFYFNTGISKLLLYGVTILLNSLFSALILAYA